jgi:hypothetical protein
MSDETSRTEDSVTVTGSDSKATEREDSVAALVSENRALRQRVDALEKAVAVIAPDFDRSASHAQDRTQSESDSDTGDSRRKLLPSGGHTVKVLGELDADDGVGVFGNATSNSGTTYGVWGEVNSSAGYGLYTPNDANVGALEVDEDGTVQRTAGPVAKGWVEANGTLAHGTNVSQVDWVSKHDWYEIELAEDVYRYDEFVTTFNTISDVGFESGAGGASGDALLAKPSDGSTHAFGFVTHRLTPD